MGSQASGHEEGACFLAHGQGGTAYLLPCPRVPGALRAVCRIHFAGDPDEAARQGGPGRSSPAEGKGPWGFYVDGACGIQGPLCRFPSL